MTDTIIKTGSALQLLLSQKGVQALITLMTIATVLVMVALGREIPQWLVVMASGFVGLYFEVPGKTQSII